MAKKKYTSYKPSKTLWQEEIPSHWQETDLRMIFTENKVKNIGLVERNLLSLSYGKLKRKDIDNATGLVPASFEGYQIIEEGYIILRFTDLQNDKKSLRVGYCPERGIITNAYVGIVPNEDIHSKYFYYQLHFLDTIKYFYNLGGGVRQSLSYKEFKRETLLVPEPEEQIKIAAFLDYKLAKINRFIQKKKQLIKLLNEQKAAIINQAVTKGLNPNANMKDSSIEWLGEIPEHFYINKVGVHSNIKRGAGYQYITPATDNDDSVKILRISDFNKLDPILAINLPEFQRYKVYLDDILIAGTGGTAGMTKYVDQSLDGMIHSYNALRISKKRNSSLNFKFLFYALNSQLIKTQMDLSFTGSAQHFLDVGRISRLVIAVPETTEEQKEIVEFIEIEEEKIAKTISTIDKEITLTQEYKTALIAEAVTGKIDLRDFEIPESTEEESYEDLEEELSIAAEDEAEYQTEEIEE